MASPKLTDIQKRSIFKALATKTQYETGIEFGFGDYYNSNTSIINAIGRIYREVAENPEKFVVSPDVVQMVEKGMEERKSHPTAIQGIKTGNLAEMSEKDLVLGAKRKVWVLLNTKLDRIMKSKKNIDEESLSKIAMVAGIAFDKGQIAMGEATEHIALKAKIDKDITAEDALSQILNRREISLTQGE